uniref:Uncharacterized protein n=1 Tax=Trichogramma kaykai TaxID=54128 RepID=A0ABD2VZ80_9HYME
MLVYIGKEQQGFGKGNSKSWHISIAPEHLRSRWLAARGTVNFPDVLADRVRCGDQRAAHASPLYRHRASPCYTYMCIFIYSSKRPLLNYYVLSRDSINTQMFNEKYIRTRESGNEPAMLSSASNYTYVFGIVHAVGARAGNLGSFDRVPHTIVARVAVLAQSVGCSTCVILYVFRCDAQRIIQRV